MHTPYSSLISSFSVFFLQGYHCLLTLTTTDLAKPSVSSLRPIVIALTPHSKTVRVKPQGGRLPWGFTQEDSCVSLR